MAANSKIEWTDHTFNPWIGCTKVHEGCTHCYAETFAKRTGKAKWGNGGSRVKTSEAYWQQPLKWNAEAAAAGERRRVFCASLADVFEDWQGPVHDHHGDLLGLDEGEFCKIVDPRTPYRATLDDLRRELFRLIDATPMLDWLLLTKRPENIRRMWTFRNNIGPPQRSTTPEQFASALHRDNVWLGTSISDQKTADDWIPRLLETRDLSPVLFLSCEPLLGPIDLRQCRTHEGHSNVLFVGNEGGWEYAGSPRNFINWLIVGGESGHGARPMHPDWARGLRDQCVAAGVPFFFKQWGEWVPANCAAFTREADDAIAAGAKRQDWENGDQSFRVGKKAAGRSLQGREWNEFPAVNQEAAR
jgi:protein gp37